MTTEMVQMYVSRHYLILSLSATFGLAEPLLAITAYVVIRQKGWKFTVGGGRFRKRTKD